MGGLSLGISFYAVCGDIYIIVCVCILSARNGGKGNGVGSRVASGKVDSAHVFDVLVTHYSNWI